MPVYRYECPRCGEFEFEQRMSDPPLPRCGCGKPVKKLIQPIATVIPAYMRAAGSKGSSEDSCDKQAAYLKSDKWYQERKRIEEKGGTVNIGASGSG